MRIRHGVTSHGFALNVDPDMTAFERFTVCGLHDVTMVSLRQLAAEQGIPAPTDAEVRDAVGAELTASWGIQAVRRRRANGSSSDGGR